MFSQEIYKYLDIALDYGIKEYDFWNMTLAEIIRELQSKKRVIENEDKKKAFFDYILADLIGHSNARVHNSKNKMPSINEAYPSIFKEEDKQDAINELSVLRFKLFAQSYNEKFENNKGVLNSQ